MSQPQDVASPVVKDHTDTEPEKHEQQQQKTHEMPEKQDAPEAHDEKETTPTMEYKQEDLDTHEKDEDSIAEKYEDKAEDNIEVKHEAKHEEKPEESNGKPEEKQQEQLSQNDTNVKRLSSGTESDDSVSVGLSHIPPSTTAVPVTRQMPSLISLQC
jgi:hypothetical protein